ncbi:MAG: 30S ribosomal protein S2 [archaeon]
MAKKDIEETKQEKEVIQQMPVERTDEKSIDAEAELYKGKNFLVDIEEYLKSGVHIGTKFKTGEMRRYIFKKRRDGLMVFNIETIDNRIKMAAKMLAKYEPKEIVIVCRRLYGHQPVKKMAAMIGAKAYFGRFIPGTFTNPEARGFHESKIMLLTDPITDFQAIKEASQVHMPIISIVGSDSPMAKVDLAIPANNKGRKSLALIFYLLTREVLVERKEISREAFASKISDFEQEIQEGQFEERQKRRPSSFGSKGPRRGVQRRPRRRD